MTVDILVPPLSQTMDTLAIVEWLKKIGDPVTKGETILTVETDKATLEVESPTTGILSVILARAGEEVKVGSIIGSIAEPGEVLEEGLPHMTYPQIQEDQPSPLASEDSKLPFETTGPSGEPLPSERLERIFASPRARQVALQKGILLAKLKGTGSGPQHLIVERDVNAYVERQKSTPRIIPLARRMAEASGVDLSKVIPSKPGATITKVDIESSLKEEVSQPAPTAIPAADRPALTPIPPESAPQPIPLTPTRKTIARRMLESHQVTAPVSYMREADATRLVKLRKRILEKLLEGTVDPTYTDFLIYMTCRVLSRHPALNANFNGETLEIHQAVHMAVAVDTPRGLIVPVIREAGSKNVEEIARLRRDLVERALAGTVSPQELSGGTFTITNLGALGIDYFTPIINPPQVAILGVGRIREVPSVWKGKIRPRRRISLALTCDHRIIDGGPAARFLTDVCNLIENPDLIWL